MIREGEDLAVWWGESEPVSVELKEIPVPLLGLRGFRLNYQDAWITRDSDHMRLWWRSLGPSATHYRVLTASSLLGSTWHVAFSGPPASETYSLMSVLLPAHGRELFVRFELTRFKW